MPHDNGLQVTFAGERLALEQVPCDFCGGASFVPFWKRMRHGLDLETVLCAQCALCQTNPRPTAEANRRFYQRLYMKFHENTSAIDGDYVTHSLKLGKPRVEALAGVIGRDVTARVFEIGCGVGGFQRNARELTRWQVSGIEPGREQHGFGRSLGLDIENSFLEDVPDTAGPFDVVVSFHVFEHSLSPSDFLRRANRLLAPNGLLYLEVPNLAWPGGDFTQFLQFPHLYSFTASTLRNYLTAIGGFRPVFVSEGRGNLAMMARKVASPRAADQRPLPGDYEAIDLMQLRRSLKVRERVFKLAALLPQLPILRKVRATLFDV